MGREMMKGDSKARSQRQRMSMRIYRGEKGDMKEGRGEDLALRRWNDVIATQTLHMVFGRINQLSYLD